MRQKVIIDRSGLYVCDGLLFPHAVIIVQIVIIAESILPFERKFVFVFVFGHLLVVLLLNPRQLPDHSDEYRLEGERPKDLIDCAGDCYKLTYGFRTLEVSVVDQQQEYWLHDEPTKLVRPEGHIHAEDQELTAVAFDMVELPEDTLHL